jgi:nucleotide-binding universal stress UspA family protein
MPGFSPKRILCAIDLSPASSGVLRWARRIAEAFASRVEVLHAEWSEWPRYFSPGQIEAFQTEARAQRAALEGEIGRMAGEILGAGIPHSVSVADGHPVPVILGRIAKEPPDLVIMGSHGRSGVARLLLGSVAENVVREAKSPTLIVRGAGDDQTGAVQRILCPVSMTELSRDALDVAAQAAAAFRAQLNVLYVVESETADPRKARELLCHWVPDEIRSRCKLQEVVAHGNAAEAIVRQAREQATDLIVVGADHRPFLEATTLGNTTERVLRHSPCSVLVLPRHAH